MQGTRAISDVTVWTAYLALLAVCLLAAVSDVRTERIPNRLTYAAMLFGLAFWFVAGFAQHGWGAGFEGLRWSFLGLLAGLIPYALLVLTAGLGGGDMKLMAAVGAISASWQVVLSTTVYALAVAAVLAVAIMVRKGVVRQTLSRILSAALVASARVKPTLPTDSPKVPFAVAVLVGVAVAGAEQMLGWQSPWVALTP